MPATRTRPSRAKPKPTPATAAPPLMVGVAGAEVYSSGSVPAAAPALDLAQLIDDFTTRVMAQVDERLGQVEARLSAAVAAQAPNVAQFVPMHSIDPTAGNGLMTEATQRRIDMQGLGQGFTGAGQRTQTKQEQDVLPVVLGMPAATHRDMLIRYPRRWTTGSHVRINPDAIHSEREDGTVITWGDILRTKVKTNPLGAGTVVRYGYLRARDGQHKYFVNVPGLTSGPPGLNNDGFLDSELLPYTPPSPYAS